ncbi:uncharacterized protein [Lepisosteus oculatus]|uniref:uncharacterized protein isoform X2 n=1 Tax=Lepisosteus oculatus TaxID=7918 RepID=UPI0035F50827
MDRPVFFRQGASGPDPRLKPEGSVPQGPGALSMKSDDSMDRPVFFRQGGFGLDPRFSKWTQPSEQWKHKAISFLLDLCLQGAEWETQTGEKVLKLLSSVCSYTHFPFDKDCNKVYQCDFLLDLYSRVKDCESQTGRTVLPALQPVFQSAPAVWAIDLSKRKASLFLEVLKLHTVRKPVELKGWSAKKSVVRSFLQCLPYISQLRFSLPDGKQEPSEEFNHRVSSFLLRLGQQIQHFSDLGDKSNFLLDLYSRVKDYESQTGRNVLPALQPVFQSAPAVWVTDLSKRKASLFLEVLKLHTVRKPVELKGWSAEESEVRSFLQCLPYISQLRFSKRIQDSEEQKHKAISFLLDLCLQGAEWETQTGEKVLELLSSVCSYTDFPFNIPYNNAPQCDFLLDLYSRVKDYESQTGRNVLPALQPVFQSAPAVWVIDLSERKASLFLEVLKLHTVRKPVELKGWSAEESEVRSFLQCLPYISQLRFSWWIQDSEEQKHKAISFLLDLCLQGAEWETQTGEKVLELLSSVCSYTHFPFDDFYNKELQCDFLLDLYSRVKDCESQRGRNVLPALQPVFQSAPAVWAINLSKRKASLFLEVLKLHTVRKPVELKGWSAEKSEVRSFLQCLPYISQLRFCQWIQPSEQWKRKAISFLLDLFLQGAEWETQTGEKVLELLSSVCSYTHFPFDDFYNKELQCDFLLDLYSRVKDCESPTGRNVLPALQPVFQSAPAVWVIDLSERKASLFLEVLKLHTVRKPVELKGWSAKKSEVRSFLQCLHYISQLRFSLPDGEQEPSEEFNHRVSSFLLRLGQQIQHFSDLGDKSNFLLDLYSRVKDYESQTGRNVLPALQPVFQSAPAVWAIDLSERKASLFLEVLKLHTVRKPVELKGWSAEKSEVRSFLQCLPYISQLRFSKRIQDSEEQKHKAISFLLDLFLQGAEWETQTGEKVLELLSSVCSYTDFPFNIPYNNEPQCDFLLDLYSCVKESRTGRNFLPALQPVFQSAPAVWAIDLSKRKASLFLEVLKLHTVRKPVELEGWSAEESEVRSFLQCLPYISQLRFSKRIQVSEEQKHKAISFLLDLCLQGAEWETQTGEKVLELLSSVCSYTDFPFNILYNNEPQCDFLLDLYSCVKDYESPTGRNVLPALQPVFQSAPAVWVIDLSERKASLFLEVLKLHTVRKPVELKGWSAEESEVRSFLQCLPYISQLRFSKRIQDSEEWKHKVISFLLDLCLQGAEWETQTGEKVLKTLVAVFNFREFLSNYEEGSNYESSIFLLDLYSRVKDCESQTGRNVLPALQPVFQSAPAVWAIDLSERKASLFLEVLKLHTVRKPVELLGWSAEESEVRSFLQCLPYISQLRFFWWLETSEEKKHKVISFLLHLCLQGAEWETQTGEKVLELLSSVCSYTDFPFDNDCNKVYQCDFLLDLYSRVKDCESQTGRTVFPALQPVFQSAPAVWAIDLSKRKASLFLEVLKLHTVRKPVVLKGWSAEKIEVRSFLQCLPYISQLRFSKWTQSSKQWKHKVISFLLDLCLQGAEWETQTGEKVLKLLSSVCSYTHFPFDDFYNKELQCDFLLDLYSRVKDCESQTGRNVLPALQSVFQSAPAVWVINLSKRKASLFLEVLKLHTVRKPVELKGWSAEKSEVRSFLQCLPYISQLRFSRWTQSSKQWKHKVISFLLDLFLQGAEWETQTGEKVLELLSSVCSYTDFPFDDFYNKELQCDFLLDLYSRVKDCESLTSRNVLPALQPVFQSAPAVWVIDLSERKASLFLEVLKLHTVRKPVELKGWSAEKSEVRSFLQCLPYISQLRFSKRIQDSEKQKHKAISFLLDLCLQEAEWETQTGEKVLKLLSSVCSHTHFPFDNDCNKVYQCDFLLDLYSRVKDCESQTGRNVLPALQPVFQSAPAVWAIDLCERKSSLFLEVLKLHTVRKPVELKGWSAEESEVRSFLQCLPYISQLRFSKRIQVSEEQKHKAISFLLDLFLQGAEWETQTGEKVLELVSSVSSYTHFPFNNNSNKERQCDFLLDLYSCVKDYESPTGRNVLPALQPVFQSAPAVWVIDLSKRKASLFLEVLKLHTVRKPVELKGWSAEESEVRSFLQCLPYISQLSCGDRFFLDACKVLSVLSTEKDQMVSALLQALGFSVTVTGVLSDHTCSTVGRVLGWSDSRVQLTVMPRRISLKGAGLLFKSLTHLQKLRMNETLTVTLARRVTSVRHRAPVCVEELSLVLNAAQQGERLLSRVLSSLVSLLRVWTVQCLDLTPCCIDGRALTVLLCHQGPLTVRLSRETLEQLAGAVYEAQDNELTQLFLEKTGGDLSPCRLDWTVCRYLLQLTTQQITVDLRSGGITEEHWRDLVPFLDRLQLKRLNSRFSLAVLRELFQRRARDSVLSFVKAAGDWINLNTRVLDSRDCAALRFALQHCSGVRLNLSFASIPEGDIESAVALLHRVSELRLDRDLLLRFLHSAVGSEQPTAAEALLQALQCTLDFSCSSGLDPSAPDSCLSLSASDCRTIRTAVQRASGTTTLVLKDCEIGDAGLEELFPILHRVRLSASKRTLQRILCLTLGGEEGPSARALALCTAMGKEVDLSHTQLDLRTCRALALVLQQTEEICELDLSHCGISDDCMELLCPCLYKVQVLDVSNNDITEQGALRIHSVVSSSSALQTVRLFNNRISDRGVFSSDQRYEIW